MSTSIQTTLSISDINQLKSTLANTTGADETKFNKILSDIQAESEKLAKDYKTDKNIFPKHDFNKLAFQNTLETLQTTGDTSTSQETSSSSSTTASSSTPPVTTSSPTSTTSSTSPTAVSTSSTTPVTSSTTTSVSIPSTKNLSTTYDSIISEMSQKYNVPFDLIKSVVNTESSFDSQATSSTGAMGLMQLMPSTASWLGVQNAYDPAQNIEGGTKYLSYLLKRFNGNLTLAVAAYNAGPGAVDKYKGIPPFQETQLYVKKVLGGQF